jgi:hypothetical protein
LQAGRVTYGFAGGCYAGVAAGLDQVVQQAADAPARARTRMWP